MGWDVTYEVQFEEVVTEWNAHNVRRQINRDLGDRYERIDFLYLRGLEEEDSVGVCIVDLYAGACQGREGVENVMNVFWNLYGIPMKFRKYKMGNTPWDQFTASPPSPQ
jgi:hypothetical protein